mgnify:CR=1 FL=1
MDGKMTALARWLKSLLVRGLSLMGKGWRREAAAALLNSLPNTPLGTELFDAVLRKTVSCCVEAVVVNGEYPIKVLLKRRADNDTTYPGQWHCPGTFLRPGESYWQAL